MPISVNALEDAERAIALLSAILFLGSACISLSLEMNLSKMEYELRAGAVGGCPVRELETLASAR